MQDSKACIKPFCFKAGITLVHTFYSQFSIVCLYWFVVCGGQSCTHSNTHDIQCKTHNCGALALANDYM